MMLLLNPSYPSSIRPKYVSTDTTERSKLIGYEDKIKGFETWEIVGEFENREDILKFLGIESKINQVINVIIILLHLSLDLF